MQLLAQGDADAAVEAFDGVLTLNPHLSSQLWQRGLALFFAGRYDEAAKQFEVDLANNGSDVEEIVFHALSVAHGASGAFPPLLPCGTDPRGATMEAVRELYAGSGTPEAVLEAARRTGAGPGASLVESGARLREP